MAKRKAEALNETPSSNKTSRSTLVVVEIDANPLRRVTRSGATTPMSTPKVTRTYSSLSKRAELFLGTESTISLKENGVMNSGSIDAEEVEDVDMASDDELRLHPNIEPLQPASPSTTRANNKKRKLNHVDLEANSRFPATPTPKTRKPTVKPKPVRIQLGAEASDAVDQSGGQPAKTISIIRTRSALEQEVDATPTPSTSGQQKKRGRPPAKRAIETSPTHPLHLAQSSSQPKPHPQSLTSSSLVSKLEDQAEKEEADAKPGSSPPPSPLKGRKSPAKTQKIITVERSSKHTPSRSSKIMSTPNVVSPKKRKRPTDARQLSSIPVTETCTQSPTFPGSEREEESQSAERHEVAEEMDDPPSSPSRKRQIRAKAAQSARQQIKRARVAVVEPNEEHDNQRRTTRKRKPKVVTSPSLHSPPSDHSSEAGVVESISLSPLMPKSLNHTSSILPQHLHVCLTAQKRSVLKALQSPPIIEIEEGSQGQDNAVGYQQLTDMLEGSMSRSEGNSCLLLGPRGSGKTRLIERCLSDLQTMPIIIRLSGWVQSTDRLALKEIAVQLAEQTDSSFLSNFTDLDEENHDAEDTNPFFDKPDQLTTVPITSSISLPPSSHLPALISMLPTLGRPTIVILDAFDLFALHPRQALLYCLLDTVQSCQAGECNKGLAVIGVTNRVDTIQLLEKRVKSRFSGRMIRITPPQKNPQWLKIVRSIYLSDIPQGSGIDEDVLGEWKGVWREGVEKFVGEGVVVRTLNETLSIAKDVRTLTRIMTPPILHLTESAPFPSAKRLISSALVQRSRPPFPFLSKLSYPCLCLLIASRYADLSGHPTFTFEMLLETFRNQVRASTAAPVQLNGSSIGMVRCSREVLMNAFEAMGSTRIFVCVAAPSPTTAKEFVKYRCVVEFAELKTAVEKTGQTHLKKWLTKAQ